MNSVTKISVITEKGFKPVTSCVGDQDATTVPARHMSETDFSDSSNSLNEFMSCMTTSLGIHTLLSLSGNSNICVFIKQLKKLGTNTRMPILYLIMQ